MSAGRIERLERALSRRTRWITVVLDDVYHRHNMSAIVRSCEAFGIQDIHVMELSNPFCPDHGVALGAEQWVTIKRYKGTDQCMAGLRSSGYRVLCADPPRIADGACYPLRQIPLDRPVALVFGRERYGLHDDVRRMCEGRFYVPMSGLTESLNVSVAVGITLYELRLRLENEVGPDKWRLSSRERLCLFDQWSVRSVKRGERILGVLKGRRACKGGD